MFRKSSLDFSTCERVLVEASGQYPTMSVRVGRVDRLIVLTSVLTLASFHSRKCKCGWTLRDCTLSFRLGEIITHSKLKI